MGNTIVIASIVAPALLLIILRSNAALTFLSLCVGSVLAQVAAADTFQVVGAATTLPADSIKYVSLSLLLVPPLLTALVMAKSVKSSHLLLHFLPAVGFGAAALMLSMPYLPTATTQQIISSPFWSKLSGLEVIIVGLTSFICLLIVWLQRPKHHKLDEHHK